jgi:hypothetical protein
VIRRLIVVRSNLVSIVFPSGRPAWSHQPPSSASFSSSYNDPTALQQMSQHENDALLIRIFQQQQLHGNQQRDQEMYDIASRSASTSSGPYRVAKGGTFPAKKQYERTQPHRKHSNNNNRTPKEIDIVNTQLAIQLSIEQMNLPKQNSPPPDEEATEYAIQESRRTFLQDVQREEQELMEIERVKLESELSVQSDSSRILSQDMAQEELMERIKRESLSEAGLTSSIPLICTDDKLMERLAQESLAILSPEEALIECISRESMTDDSRAMSDEGCFRRAVEESLRTELLLMDRDSFHKSSSQRRSTSTTLSETDSCRVGMATMNEGLDTPERKPTAQDFVVIPDSSQGGLYADDAHQSFPFAKGDDLMQAASSSSSKYHQPISRHLKTVNFLHVENAGLSTVNGIYKRDEDSLSQLFTRRIELNGDTSLAHIVQSCGEWRISVSPRGCLPGSDHDVIVYSTLIGRPNEKYPSSSSTWTTIDCRFGSDPAPIVSKVNDLLSITRRESISDQSSASHSCA